MQQTDRKTVEQCPICLKKKRGKFWYFVFWFEMVRLLNAIFNFINKHGSKILSFFGVESS